MSAAVDKALLRENWQANLIALYTIFGLLRNLPLRQMIDMAETSQAIAPLLHPTAYIQKGGAAAQDLDILRAGQAFVDQVEADYRRAGVALPDLKVPA